MKHNLNEDYLCSLSEDELINEMKEWNANEQVSYLCPNGVMTIEEFRNYGTQLINDEYDKLGW